MNKVLMTEIEEILIELTKKRGRHSTLWMYPKTESLEEAKQKLLKLITAREEQIKEKAHDYFKKIIWSDKDIEYFDRAVFDKAIQLIREGKV